MSTVSVTDLRQNLPAYLKRVQSGQRILVTSHGRVIAELKSPSPEDDAAEQARKLLKGSIRRYDRPFEPAFLPGEWESES